MSLKVRIYGLKTSRSERFRRCIYLSDLNPELAECAALLEIASQNVKLAFTTRYIYIQILWVLECLGVRQVRLVVMTPEVRILGDPDIHVKEGSEVRVECVISNTTDLVPYVTWLFKNQVNIKTYFNLYGLKFLFKLFKNQVLKDK